MEIISVSLENFASYEKLDFIFADQGLTLIQGPTGSGKSTLCDAIPWVLFGRTAKGGNVDEILSWPGGKTTKGAILLNLNGKLFSIARIRGKSNDLWFSYEDGPAQRGKDLQDTQKLINNLLSINYDLYLAGSYFHEFSQTAQFFTTTAKNRRVICEQLVDLSLASNLQDKTVEETKHNKILEANIETALISCLDEAETFKRLQISEKNRAAHWEENNRKMLSLYKEKYERFELDREKAIKQLKAKLKVSQESTTCSECGAPKQQNPHAGKSIQEAIISKINEVNIYVEILEKEMKEENPHKNAVKDYSDEVTSLEELAISLSKQRDEYTEKLAYLGTLSDILIEFRSVLVQNTIARLEDQTNMYLEEFFDSEFKIKILVNQDDKLDIEIFRNGNECSYTQLSKGQRGVLKLTFGVAVMKEISNHNGLSFNCAFFDESLDGMDDGFKLKSIKLLERLVTVYKTVFIVEHSETIKAHIDNKYSVSLTNEGSIIELT